MPFTSQRWTAEQIRQMNEARFMEELLDTLRFSPRTSTADFDLMHSKLNALEDLIKLRLSELDTKKEG